MQREEFEQSQESQSSEDDSQLTQGQKKRVIAILFGRLLRMHQRVMAIGALVHVSILVSVLFHMFNLGTIESENSWCYFTWPLMHLFYAFVNYVFVWFFCFNAFEIKKKNGSNILKISNRFLKIFSFLSTLVFPLKWISQNNCESWSLSWKAVYTEFAHILLVTLCFYVYFSWFEKKYIGFRIYYKSSNFN